MTTIQSIYNQTAIYLYGIDGSFHEGKIVMFIYLSMIETPEDRSKFEYIYTTYKGLMMKTAMDILKNFTDAEDAVHQAFVYMAEKIETVDTASEKELRSYVCLLTEHRAIDIYRRQKNHPLLDFSECSGIVIEYHGDNTLSANMAKLSVQYRTVLLLKFHHGYTTKEIAKMLKRSEASVHKTIQRAREKLKVMCEKDGLL